MGQLSLAEWQSLLQPYASDAILTPALIDRLDTYLELLLRWNRRTNLTAVRDGRQIVQRQIGESLLAMPLVRVPGSLLDFGSGAGFPGVPLGLAMPELQVTLAESQGKKSAFLREAVRILELRNTAVWCGRAEDLPESARFDTVTMRAVDESARMLPIAARLAGQKGTVLLFTGSQTQEALREEWIVGRVAIPRTAGSIVALDTIRLFHVEQSGD